MVTIASDDEATAKHLPDTAAFLTAHGIDTMVGRSEGSVLWDKLIRLAALACTTAATNRPIGYIRSDPHWKTVMEKIVFEAEAVAKAWDVVIDHDVQMKILTDLPESLSSSLQRDIEAGKPSELDAIAGALIRAGKLRGISCPTIEKLMGQILKPGETS
jgi:2-dehydropantoate 2-reductase